MIIKFDDYKKKVDKNLIEYILLVNGFKHQQESYNTYKKRIDGVNLYVDVRNSHIKFHKSKKLIYVIEYETKPNEFWYHLEFLNFI